MVRTGRPAGEGRRASRSAPPSRALLALAVLIPIVVVVAVLAAASGGGDDDRQSARPQSGALAAGAVPTPTSDGFDAARAMALVRLQVGAGPAARRLAGPARAGPAPALRSPRRAVRGHAWPSPPAQRHRRAARPPAGCPRRRPLRHPAAAARVRRRQRRGGGHGRGRRAGPGAGGRGGRAARAREVRFVLFDGEELPRAKADSEDFEADALRGSKAYAAAHARRGRPDGAPGLHRRPRRAAAARGHLGPRACGRACGRRRRAWAPAPSSPAAPRSRSSTTTPRSCVRASPPST